MPSNTLEPTTASRLEILPITHVSPKKGFNPRSKRDKAKFTALAKSIASGGVKQSILVTPDPDRDERYLIVAGESRYLAALDAGLEQIPCLIDAVHADTGGLDVALVENLLREDLSFMDEARGLHRLRELGLTVRGITERVPRSQQWVRERLQLVALPEELHAQIDEGTVPLTVCPTLVKLADIHPGLPMVAVRRVQDPPPHTWDEPFSWEDVMRDPIAVVIGSYPEQAADLPADVYVAGQGYPFSRFALDEQAAKRLTQLVKLTGVDASELRVRFGRDLTAQALALGAAHPSGGGYEHLIVGQGVADQLAGDFVALTLKEQRKRAKTARAAENARRAEGSDEQESGVAVAAPVSEEERREQAAHQREQAKQDAASARAYNQVLGGQLLKQLYRVKVDERVLKILSAAPLASDLQRIATRGARLCFAGWPVETPRKNATVKVTYLPGHEARAKAREYLDGATGGKAGEIAGRCLALLAAARWANEDAVPMSQRSQYELRLVSYTGIEDLPWSREAEQLLDDILIEKLSPEASEPIRHAKHERETRQAEQERRQREQDDAVLDLAQRAPSLTVAERQDEIDRIRSAHGYMAIDHHVATVLLDLATCEAPGSTSPYDPDVEDAVDHSDDDEHDDETASVSVREAVAA